MQSVDEQAQAMNCEIYNLVQPMKIAAGWFLELPNKNNLLSLLTLSDGVRAESAACKLMENFSEQCTAETLEDLLEEVARDRARLVRGVGPGGLLPYESQYTKNADALFSVKEFCSEHDCSQSTNVHESAEQLGMELDMTAFLIARTDALTHKGRKENYHNEDWKEFWSNHPGTWIRTYAADMANAANTEYYRAAAKFLIELADKVDSIIKQQCLKGSE